jgi:hypothetical protein
MILRRSIAVFAVVAVSLSNGTAADPGDESFFRETVYPLIESKCLGCHGEEKDREGELDLRTRDGFLAGGESGKPAVIPGKPDESPAFRAILRQDKMKMPPKDRNALSADEIDVFRQWIVAGAPWGQPKTSPKWSYKPEDIWAFAPVQLRKPPADDLDASRVKTPIDAFLQQKLNAQKLKQAPPADKLALIRRATLDLTGLPPTPDEIDAFLRDKSPQAFDTVTERLLASARYGEHWARHWLDVVRYADSDGFSNDYERPNAWRYRDYVIRSFNADKPYDRFITEQIAGDETFCDCNGDPNEAEKLIAVGMLRMGPWEQTSMSVAAETRQLFLDDVTANVGAAYLGLTTGCARCHDHKLDPIPTKDY